MSRVFGLQFLLGLGSTGGWCLRRLLVVPDVVVGLVAVAEVLAPVGAVVAAGESMLVVVADVVASAISTPTRADILEIFNFNLMLASEGTEILNSNIHTHAPERSSWIILHIAWHIAEAACHPLHAKEVVPQPVGVEA